MHWPGSRFSSCRDPHLCSTPPPSPSALEPDPLPCVAVPALHFRLHPQRLLHSPARLPRPRRAGLASPPLTLRLAAWGSRLQGDPLHCQTLPCDLLLATYLKGADLRVCHTILFASQTYSQMK